jgi:hypothetical protein
MGGTGVHYCNLVQFDRLDESQPNQYNRSTIILYIWLRAAYVDT